PQQRHAELDMVTEQTQRRNRVTGQLQGDEDGRYGVGHDQYHVLSDLGVGDGLLATEYGVGEYHGRSDPETGGVAHFEEAREGNTVTGHLADHVGHGDDYQADHRSQARATTVETVTDEIRHGELAELAQVGCQQHRQQHVAAG